MSNDLEQAGKMRQFCKTTCTLCKYMITNDPCLVLGFGLCIYYNEQMKPDLLTCEKFVFKGA